MSLEFDTDRILSDSRQWLELSCKWGEPIDLDEDINQDSEGTDRDSHLCGTRHPAFCGSSLNVNRTTFDSSKVIARWKRARETPQAPQGPPKDYGQFADEIQLNKQTAECDIADSGILRPCICELFKQADCHLGLPSASSTMRQSFRLENGRSVAFADESSISACWDECAPPKDCEITPVLCDEFSKIVERVSKELSYLERHGRRRGSRRKVSRGDVRHVRWNRMAVAN